MKTLSVVVVIAGVMAMSYRAGEMRQYHRDARKIHLLFKQVEVFENPVVFHNAENVARITGTPLYQVLTGKVDPK